MILAEIATLALYIGSMVVLPQYFGRQKSLPYSAFLPAHLCTMKDLSFIISQRFIFKVGVIVAISSFPLYAIKVIRSRFAPAAYVKVSQF